MTCVNGIYRWFVEKPILYTKIHPTSKSVSSCLSCGMVLSYSLRAEAECNMNGYGDVGFRELDFYFWFGHQLWPRSLHLSCKLLF